MALTQKLDATHPRLSPPCEARLWSQARRVCLVLFLHLQPLPSLGFPYAERMSTTRLESGWASLLNMPPLTSSLWLPLSPVGHSGGHAEPCLDSRHRKLKHMPFVLFLSSSSQSVPRKLSFCSLSLSIWRDGKGRLSRPSEDFQKLRWKQTLRRKFTRNGGLGGPTSHSVWLSILQAWGGLTCEAGQESAGSGQCQDPLATCRGWSWPG